MSKTRYFRSRHLHLIDVVTKRPSSLHDRRTRQLWSPPRRAHATRSRQMQLRERCRCSPVRPVPTSDDTRLQSFPAPISPTSLRVCSLDEANMQYPMPLHLLQAPACAPVLQRCRGRLPGECKSCGASHITYPAHPGRYRAKDSTTKSHRGTAKRGRVPVAA